MNNELSYSINKFTEAFNRLNEGVLNVEDDLDKDGVIQRFEFTFELLWKTLKLSLEERGIICRSPLDCLKEAFKINLIDNEAIFIQMLKDRNKTSRIYNKEESEVIFQNIKNDYVKMIDKLVKKLNY